MNILFVIGAPAPALPLPSRPRATVAATAADVARGLNQYLAEAPRDAHARPSAGARYTAVQVTAALAAGTPLPDVLQQWRSGPRRQTVTVSFTAQKVSPPPIDVFF